MAGKINDLCAVQGARIRDFFTDRAAQGLFRLSLWLTALFIPWYNTGLSVAQILMGAAVLWPGNWGRRLRRLANNPYALSWAGLYVLLWLSQLYSENRSIGWQFLRTMIPLFSFPLSLALRGGISPSEFRQTAFIFLMSVVGVSLYDLFYLGNNEAAVSDDHRLFSRTVSHLRMGYFLVWSLVLCLEGWRLGWMKGPIAAAGAALALLMLALLKSVGMIPFVLLAGLLYLFISLKKDRRLRLPALLTGAGVLVFIGLETSKALTHFYKKPDPQKRAELLSLKPPFTHWDGGFLLENGVPALAGIHEASLESGWNQRSALPYHGNDLKGQPLRTTLVRYLASKGFWIKDSQAVMSLDEADISAIERGCANCLICSPFSLAGRLYEILWELRQYARDSDPRGRSLATRLELWKAGFRVLQKHWRRGTGVGDIRASLSEALDARHSLLPYSGDYGPHNQWLAIAIAGGLPLLFWAFLAFLMPLFTTHFSLHHRLPFIFMLLLMLFCGFWEDIFETQASVTFFCFFYWTSFLSRIHRNS